MFVAGFILVFAIGTIAIACLIVGNNDDES